MPTDPAPTVCDSTLRAGTGRRSALALAAAAAAGLLTSCALDGQPAGAQPFDVAQGTVIDNVTIVDTRDGTLRAGMTLVLTDGRIARMLPTPPQRPMRPLTLAPGVTRVDGSGQFAVPGYLDMHTHAMPPPGAAVAPWPLLLAHGITGVREMSGSPAAIQRARQLNADSQAGRIAAPEVLQMPAELVAGNPPAAAMAALVDRNKAAGGDFIKLITANREATLALLDQAGQQGLGVAGHLPIAISAVDAAQAGMRAIEHLGAGLGILLDCATDEAAIRRALLSGAGARPPFPPTAVVSPLLYRAVEAPFYQRLLDSHDPAKCQAVIQTLASRQTWQVPTLLRLKTMAGSSDAAYRQDANLVYVDKTTRALWQSLADQYDSQVPASAAASFKAHFKANQKLLGLMQNSGVKLLAGSDLGGIWIIPGASLHQEFAELAVAGLSPLQVLQSTTLNGAEFLGRQASMGTLEVGKNADLVLLEANPLQDVAHLARISGVVLKGRYLPKATLQAMKDGAAQALAAQPLRQLSAVLDADHVH